MILSKYAYIILPAKSGDLRRDVRNLLEQNGKAATYEHATNVAAVCRDIAEKYHLNPSDCTAAAVLHDVSAIIPPTDMLRYAQAHGLSLCEAELRHPFLLHQRISRIIAEEYFEVTHQDVLSAIECHTTLRPNASDADMALFIADKLAWDQPGTPPFEATVRSALESSLEEACLAYMNYMTINGKVLFPHANWSLAIDWLHSALQ